ncbi:MAG: formate dehydrogenase subunit delta [Alphaproteobacteria bacterium]|nr:formate dehydrogenase subunit delta [Alphaproteobacteria bacterium]MDE2339445.1 formate dehydrogenase subunit delta [Alphaproteobacteria bacterium]
MANQIAANLAHEPDPVAATKQHIIDFWDPRMKAMIKAYAGDHLNDTARAAVAQLG